MAARGFGRLVFVTSAVVRQPQPDLAVSVVLRAAVTAAAGGRAVSLTWANEAGGLTFEVTGGQLLVSDDEAAPPLREGEHGQESVPRYADAAPAGSDGE